MSEQTFVTAVLRGVALAGDIDDWIARWHMGGSSKRELHDYLGMSWEEYRLWVEQPSALRWILAAHKRGQHVGAIREVATLAAAAARAEHHEEASQVIDWLRRTGRVAGV